MSVYKTTRFKNGETKKKMKCEQEANEWNEEANYVRDDRQSSFRAQLIQKREPNNTTQRTNKPKGVISCSKCVHSPLHLFECMIVYIRFFHSVDDVHVCVFTWDRLGVYACAFLCHPFSSYIYIYSTEFYSCCVLLLLWLLRLLLLLMLLLQLGVARSTQMPQNIYRYKQVFTIS